MISARFAPDEYSDEVQELTRQLMANNCRSTTRGETSIGSTSNTLLTRNSKVMQEISDIHQSAHRCCISVLVRKF